MFEPQNELERSLMKAASEPGHRAQFYRDFLESEIFILPVGELPEIKGGVIQDGAKLSAAPAASAKIRLVDVKFAA